MMDAGQTVELQGELLDGWLGGRRQPGLGQARERGRDVAQGEHAGGLLVGGSVLVP